VTDAEVENVDYSDPVIPPDVQVEQRDRNPRVDDMEDVFVSSMDDNDDGGVGA